MVTIVQSSNAISHDLLNVLLCKLTLALETRSELECFRVPIHDLPVPGIIQNYIVCIKLAGYPCIACRPLALQ